MAGIIDAASLDRGRVQPVFQFIGGSAAEVALVAF